MLLLFFLFAVGRCSMLSKNLGNDFGGVEGKPKMDLWVVAAVAGAGCLAKHWNRLSNNGDSSSQLYSNFDNPDSPRHAVTSKDVSLDRRALDVDSVDGLLATELASSKGFDSEKVRCFRDCNESNVLSLSNFSDVEDRNDRSSNIGANCGFLLPDLSARELSYIAPSPGNKTFFKTEHWCGHTSSSRSLNSLESCLMAQLCKAHAKVEQCVSSSSSTATRSFHVIDGSQIISRKDDDDDSCSALIGSEEYKLRGEADQVKDENELLGVPALPKVESINDAKKMKSDAGIEKNGILTSSNIAFTGKHIHSQHDAIFLFSLGISFGIITSILANKREKDKLRELLKQTEILAQDLQEELEMKDSMTVKELQSENYGSQDTCDYSFRDKELSGFFPEKHMDNSPIIDCKKSYDQKEEESSESMSKIEAELEAELERLGFNMNESSEERSLSELAEDPDFVADFSQDELPTDMISGNDFVHPKLNEDANSTMSFPVNYVVSPHELSLRLHEVIQSRLEKRVQELEVALQYSQRKLQFMESEHESPAAYIDTYEDLMKTGESGENSPSREQCGANGPVTYFTFNEERLSRELSLCEVTMLERQNSYELNDVDEDCDCDYEVESELIRQIVERTKRGSPFFQNARSILYSMDEDEF